MGTRRSQRVFEPGPGPFTPTMEKMAPVGNERESPVWFSGLPVGSDSLLSLKLIGLFLPCWHL